MAIFYLLDPDPGDLPPIMRICEDSCLLSQDILTQMFMSLLLYLATGVPIELEDGLLNIGRGQLHPAQLSTRHYHTNTNTIPLY